MGFSFSKRFSCTPKFSSKAGFSSDFNRTDTTAKATDKNVHIKEYSILSVVVNSKNTYVLVILQYKQAKPFNGEKIAIYTMESWTKALARAPLNGIDPHFLENDTSPLARFAPTKEGEKAALKLFRQL